MEQWGKTAQSFANGIQYRENRTKAVLKAVAEAMDQMEGFSTLYVEIEWKDNSVESANTIRAQVGVSTIGKHLEIHVQKGGIPIFAYRTVEDKSSLFSTELNKSISFQTPGVFPVPKFDVQRDVETGGFAYNFNLNFSTTQDKLIDEGIKILESPYLGTSKGREVFLNYLLSEKGLWISPAKNITGGTSFPLSMLNPENPVPTSVNLTIDLSRKLRSLQIGSFFISNFSQGDATVMKKLPSWPSAEQSKEEKFDFNLLMKLIQNLMGNTK